MKQALLLVLLLPVFCFSQITLSNNVTVASTVDRNSDQYFSFNVPSSQFEFIFAINQVNGPIVTNTYLKKNQIPSYSDYDYYFTGSENPKRYFISPCTLSPGTWYLAILGSTSVSYTSYP